jgi:hypothetical protein
LAGICVKLPQFEKSWHGIEFSSLPVQLAKRQPANDAFYDAFYAELGKRAVDPAWRLSKERLGDWVECNILRPRKLKKLLSVAVGLAIAEQKWLESGYQVVLNECQAKSLAAVRARFPEAIALIGNAHELDIADKFEGITVFTVDYALSDNQLGEMFRRLHQALTPAGILLNQTVNILTIRRILAEAVKRWILRRYECPGWVLWGWSRSPNSIIRLAQRAGLRLTDQFLRSETSFRRRPRLLWRLPPLREQDMIMLFERAD